MAIDHSLQKEASRFRNSYEIGPTDPIVIQSLALRLKAVLVFKSLSSGFSGMSCKLGEYNFMLINSEDPIGRQNFTICHELFHLFIQKDTSARSCVIESFDRKYKNEYKADLFASYLLLPDAGILSLIPEAELKKDRITLQTLLKIEHYYQCSRAALLIRLSEISLITLTHYEKYKSDVINSARHYGFDVSLYQPGRHDLVLGDYGIRAKNLFDSEKISETHYISLMKDIGVDITDDNDQVSI